MKLDTADKLTHDEANCGDPLEAFIRDLLATQALDVSCYDREFLAKSIAKRMQTTGMGTVADYCAHLAESRAEAEEFHRSLRSGHSAFFRNPLTFALLEQHILPELLKERKQHSRSEIRIWSAGCAAGQEAWSIAILLDELTRADDPPHPYRIFASDLSAQSLAVARVGVYSAEAVGNVRLHQLDECFTRHGECFAIASRLRDQVNFSAYDLLDEDTSSPQASIYGDFDLILCCNLLFYYRPCIQQRILDKLCRDLVPGGYLVTGETERKTVAARDGLCALSAAAAVFHKNTIMSAHALPVIRTNGNSRGMKDIHP